MIDSDKKRKYLIDKSGFIFIELELDDSQYFNYYPNNEEIKNQTIFINNIFYANVTEFNFQDNSPTFKKKNDILINKMTIINNFNYSYQFEKLLDLVRNNYFFKFFVFLKNFCNKGKKKQKIKTNKFKFNDLNNLFIIILILIKKNKQKEKKKNITIQKNQNHFTLGNLLRSGGFNSFFSLKSKNIGIRLNWRDLNSEQMKNELNGLLIQKIFSDEITEFGISCPYISKVYEYGKYNILEHYSFQKYIKYPFEKKTKQQFSAHYGIYAILENLKGGDLFDRIEYRLKKYNNFEVNDIIFIICQILEALKCLNEHNYAHFDIKPENIILKKKDSLELKLIDFSFSKNFLNHKWMKTSRKGTIQYIAPEVLNFKMFNIKSDIWSLGVILTVLIHPYELPNRLYKYGNSFYSYLDSNRLHSFLIDYVSNNSFYSRQDKIILIKLIDELLINMMKEISIFQDKRWSSTHCLKYMYDPKNNFQIPYLPYKSKFVYT